MPERPIEPPFTSRDVFDRVHNVSPGDLCRAVMYDDPAAVAAAMAAFYDDPDRCAQAAAWLMDLADRIGELGRG